MQQERRQLIMAQFDDFIDAVREGAQQLAVGSLRDLAKEARHDADAFLQKTRKDMQNWTKLLAAGDLTKQDFTDLVKAKVALAEIHALTQTGIALADLDRFRSGLVNLVIDKAFAIFL
jgi:hypothetical protein